MKRLLMFLLISSSTYAQVSNLDIRQFNFNYEAPHGEGEAEHFSWQQKNREIQTVKVEKVGEELKVNLQGVENRELTLKDLPDFIQGAQSIQFVEFNANLQQRVSLSFSDAMFSSEEDHLELSQFSLDCDRLQGEPELKEQLIHGCVQKMNLRAGNFSSQAQQGLMLGLKSALVTPEKGSLGIRNLQLKINGGKFQLSADIRAQISGGATANGSISYQAQQNQLAIKISEVKFGFLDVTSKVFDELKKQESATLKVSKPYVYLTIK